MNRRFFIISLVAFAILSAAVYLLSHSEPPSPPSEVAKIPERETTSRQLLVDRESGHSRLLSAPAPPKPVLSTAEWQQQRDAILGSAVSSAEKAAQLRDLLPRLSEADEVEGTKHFINLLSDDQFPMVTEMVTNAQTPNAVQELLFNDSLNRPERVKFPLWLAVARTADNPRAGTARNMLAATLPQDNGTNWNDWAAQIDARLNR